MLSCYNFGEVSWPGKEENLSGEDDVVEVSQLLPWFANFQDSRFMQLLLVRACASSEGHGENTENLTLLQG